MPRGPSRAYPSIPVKEAAQVAQTIRDKNAGRPMNRLLLAEAMGRSPTSTQFRDLITASGKYGFTKGSYAAELISLTERGEQLTKPRDQEEHLEALRAGMHAIPLFSQMLTFYNNNKLPAPQFLRNALEREPFKVEPEWAEEAATVFTSNGRDVGFVRTINSSPYVVLESGPPIDSEPGAAPASDVETGSELAPAVPLSAERSPMAPQNGAVEPQSLTVQPPDTPPAVTRKPTRPENRQFFIAHGWDKEAVAQLQAMLNRLRIPFVVAQEEANAGRPISQKIRDLMKSCSAGIFIFSADEEFKDKDGNTLWRPRENVIYELGAASLEYGQRIVIFKEKGVYFATDFRDLGYIEYEKGSLDAKAMDLLMELIALGAVKITAGD
jgi:predicted nucleotide-binding protein